MDAGSDGMPMNEVVLVTGATGYVALHCVQQLLHSGYHVRGTVRSKTNEKKVGPLRRLAGESNRLELVEADLTVADDWPSCSAINDGHRNDSRVFDETCWTDINSPIVDDYAKSKTLAEKAAWDFWNTLDRNTRFSLTVLNPTFIIGPVLSDSENGSCTVIGRIMDFRTYLASPKVSLGVVDVRDVARAHVEALKRPETDGERILISARSVWFKEMMDWLRKEFKHMGYNISRIEAPNWLVKMYAALNVDKQVQAVMHRIGPELRFNNSKSHEIMGMDYTEPRISLSEMVHSMIDYGMIRMTTRYAKRRAHGDNFASKHLSRSQAV
ncbi:unnamed protein product [Nippostrongylus brasiliensis]|uniref:Epimerase domain-containing protein n=1 Tax=Nippostrongylus brasiliensis TaxID=27835 RepID=A0A0N4Y1A7_NIPBR|nr:unnamed protein product [Nippostrongylus brasiliensis]